MPVDHHDQVRAALRELAGSVGLIRELDERALPACHNANMMQIENTLSVLGSALREVHDVPLGDLQRQSPAPVDRKAMRMPGRRLTDSPYVDPVSTVELVRARGERHSDGPTQEPLSGPYAHLTRTQLVDLVEGRLDLIEARGDEQVLLQGRPTLDNLRLFGPRAEGFNDWELVAVGDRHFDLAIASRDLVAKCGPVGLSVFLDAYGLDLVDPVRLDWYSHTVELLA